MAATLKPWQRVKRLAWRKGPPDLRTGKPMGFDLTYGGERVAWVRREPGIGWGFGGFRDGRNSHRAGELMNLQMARRRAWDHAKYLFSVGYLKA